MYIVASKNVSNQIKNPPNVITVITILLLSQNYFLYLHHNFTLPLPSFSLASVSWQCTDIAQGTVIEKFHSALTILRKFITAVKPDSVAT